MLRQNWLEETIVAISTPPGEGGIGVVRISGEKAVAVSDHFFKAKNGKSVASQKSFTVRFGHVKDRDGRVIDEALLLLMKAPKSYTGEDVVEISVHGGQAVLQSVVRLALAAGARLAEPGEFTKRAFLNGRMDLLQAEAVLEMIRAKTDRSLGWAAAQLEGVLSKKIKIWKDELVDLMSHLEASIDFPDDFPETDSVSQIRKRIQKLLEELRLTLEDSELALLAKRGFKVVLWGRPNVGKSSLLNCFVRKERAIVTPYPGTTRDVVEEEISLGGFPIRFQDTAGVHDTEHPIEKEGIERSKKAMAGADLILMVLDASQALSDSDHSLLKEIKGKPVVLALNKSDLPSRLNSKELKSISDAQLIIPCSCVQERGTQELEKALLGILTNGKLEASEEALITTARQKDLLEKVSKALLAGMQILDETGSPELIASDLRQGLDYLGALVGEVVTDDILEVLFKQFCIGK